MVKTDRDHHGSGEPGGREQGDCAVGGWRSRLGAVNGDGLLLGISSSIAHDLLKGVFMKGITEPVNFGQHGYGWSDPPCRLFGPEPRLAAQVVALAFGLAASSIFPVIILGILDMRPNDLGAIAGMP